MLDGAHIAGFLAAAALITLSPGPDNLMVLSLGLARGRRQGVSFGLGCALGCLSHTTLAALGISAMVAASPVLFTALKICGGLYLVWLGVRAIRSSDGIGAQLSTGALPQANCRSLFLQGLLANSINPKVILFFLAFLPQFIDAAKGQVGWQTALLGVLFTLQAALQFAAIGWFSGRMGGWLRSRPSVGTWLHRLAGAVFLGFGAKLIFGR